MRYSKTSTSVCTFHLSDRPVDAGQSLLVFGHQLILPNSSRPTRTRQFDSNDVGTRAPRRAVKMRRPAASKGSLPFVGVGDGEDVSTRFLCKAAPLRAFA